MVWKRNDGCTDAQYQRWMNLTVGVSFRVCLIRILSCIHKILKYLQDLNYKAIAPNIVPNIRMINCISFLNFFNSDRFFRRAGKDNNTKKLTLIVMDIIVVSSSSVSMYSMNPFATRSCQPSSGDSWRNISR